MAQQIQSTARPARLDTSAVRRSFRPLDALLRWRWFPAVFHWPLYAVLAVLIYFAFAPGQRGEGNLATEVVWRLWWPLLPFVLLVLGRVWCGVCPFGGLSDLAGRLIGRRPAPPAIIRKAGPWLGAVSVLGFGVAFLALGLEGNAGATGIILIGISAMAFGLSLAYRGRNFCRYLCPVGMITRVYSFFSWTRPEGGHGAKAEKACPVGLSPVSLAQPSQCQLCGACSGASSAQPEAAGSGWRRSTGILTSFAPTAGRLPGAREFGPVEAVLSLLLLSLMTADSVRMTSLFARYQQNVMPWLGYDYRATILAGIAVLLSAFLALQLLAARFGGRGLNLSQSFTRVGYVLLPLTMGVFLALALQHLWSGAWPSLQTILVESRLIDWSGHMPPKNVYFISLPLKAIQFSLLGVGLFLSIRAAGRRDTPAEAGRSGDAGSLWSAASPGGRAMVLLAGAAFGILFFLPMSGAC